MKKDITRFGISLLITICLLVIVDLAVGFVGDRLAWNMPNFSGQIAKDNYRLHRMDAEVVIIGSSRGAHHYVTSQLNDSIDNLVGRHVTVYNAAIQGKFANSNCCAAEAVLSRYHPKLVIFDMPENQMRAKEIESDIVFSSPYYWSDSIVKRYIDKLGLKEKLIMKSSLCRYNGKLSRIAFSYLQNIPFDDGYAPKYGSTVDFSSKITELTMGDPLNPLSADNLVMVFNKYNKAKVPLVMVCSPGFRPEGNNLQLKKLCDCYGIPFLDLYDIQEFDEHPSWFHDPNHLNDTGAHEYTALFYQEIKTIIDSIYNQ